MAAAATLALSAPAAQPDQCGGVHSAAPTHRHGHERPPLAIGDSTMLLALDDLAAIGYEANAHGCREYAEALGLMRQRRAQGSLPHMVVVALGADGAVTHDDLVETLRLLGQHRLLVLVTPRKLGGGWGSDTTMERDEGRAHPDRILVLDWVRYSAGRGEWFQPDGIHLTTDGAHAFTRLLARALPHAYPPAQEWERKGSEARIASALRRDTPAGSRRPSKPRTTASARILARGSPPRPR